MRCSYGNATCDASVSVSYAITFGDKLNNVAKFVDMTKLLDSFVISTNL